MGAFYQEPDHTIYCGHALDILRQMPDESVDMVITSPPYWGLRSYKTEPIVWDDHQQCEHEWGDDIVRLQSGGGSDKQRSNKGSVFWRGDSNFCVKCGAWRGELGLEPTIELYVAHLLEIFNEIKRALKKTGTLWVVIDDSYAGSGHGYLSEIKGKQATNKGTLWLANQPPAEVPDGLQAKSLCAIPERFTLGMLEAGWILRNRICWNKPNAMCESAADRFTASWEYVFFFTKSKKYWFDQQFEPYTEPLDRWGGDILKADGISTWDVGVGQDFYRNRNMRPNPLGRNKRDVWTINTQPYPDAHFATFPVDLVTTPILSGCPPMICRRCSKPRRKIYEGGFTDHNGQTATAYEKGSSGNRLSLLRQAARAHGGEYVNDKQCTGYTDCGCNAGFEAGVVLDPFTGSGTAQAVAKRLGRKSIGIELNPDYCKLAARRLQEIPIPMPLLAS